MTQEPPPTSEPDINAPDISHSEAMACIRGFARDLPPGWRSDRDEAGSR